MALSMSSNVVRQQQCRELKSSCSESSRSRIVNPALSDDDADTPFPLALTELSDEVLLAVANQLSINDTEDLNSLQALALTCRKMSGIVSDKTRLEKAFRIEIPKVVELMPRYEWNTMRQAARFNNFQQKIHQFITGVMEPEINAIDRWSFSLPTEPTEGWKNITEIGLLLHAKMRAKTLGFDDLPYGDRQTLLKFTDGEKLVLLYSALLWQEVYFSWLPLEGHAELNLVEITDRSFFTTLRSAFIIEGPELLLKMCRDPRTTPRDIGHAKEMFEYAKMLRNRTESLAWPGVSDEYWLRVHVESHLKNWAGEGKFDLSRSLEGIGIGKEGRKTLLNGVQVWSKMNWRNLPWSNY